VLTAIQVHFRQFAENQLVNWKQDDDVIAAMVNRAMARAKNSRSVRLASLHEGNSLLWEGTRMGTCKLCSGVLRLFSTEDNL
jgi:hypothetical protein